MLGSPSMRDLQVTDVLQQVNVMDKEPAQVMDGAQELPDQQKVPTITTMKV